MDSVRRVQRTGGSSLAVTLPKSWIDAMNLEAGDALRFKDLGEGRLEISVSAPTKLYSGEQKVLHVQATNAPPHLVSRLLVGAYITGQDRVLIMDDTGISTHLRREIEKAVLQVLGMSVVQEQPNSIEVQVFVDPTKHRLPSLLDRVFKMLRMEIDICRQALARKDAKMLDQVETIESEIDKFSLLMIRQILLSSNDFSIAKEVGVPSHHFQLGYRVAAKGLEVTGDSLASLAGILRKGLAHPRALPPGIISGIDDMLASLDDFVAKTMHLFAFESAEVPAEANDLLDKLDSALEGVFAFSSSLPKKTHDVTGAATVQRILSCVVSVMESLKILNEGMINRSVEPELIARQGGGPILTSARRRGP
jgi:phosphate uptake regulator